MKRTDEEKPPNQKWLFGLFSCEPGFEIFRVFAVQRIDIHWMCEEFQEGQGYELPEGPILWADTSELAKQLGRHLAQEEEFESARVAMLADPTEENHRIYMLKSREMSSRGPK